MCIIFRSAYNPISVIFISKVVVKYSNPTLSQKATGLWSGSFNQWLIWVVCYASDNNV